jgi:hypothetical protein
MATHNLPHKLAVELEHAKFPSKYTRAAYEESPKSLPDPTSDELIEALGLMFKGLQHFKGT